MPRTTADELLIQTRYLVLNLPSLEIKSEKTRDFAGKPGVLVEITAEGTGRALSLTGLGKPIPPQGEKQMPTRREWARIPLGTETGTIEVFFHCPEADYEALRPAWEGVLASLRWAR